MSPELILSSGLPLHGGNLSQEALRLGLQPSQLLDASASLVPFRPPGVLRRALKQAIWGSALRDYPDHEQRALRQVIADWHGVLPEAVLKAIDTIIALLNTPGWLGALLKPATALR